MKRTCLALLIVFSASADASTKMLVTVVEPKSGKPVTGLKAGDFNVLDDKTPRQVEAADYTSDILDVILLLDTSLAGPMVQPLAENFVAQLQPKEQMAIVSFHSSADLIQDFTSSQELLRRAISQVKYGNTPHVLDALYATIDGGFQSSTFRRVVLMLTAGLEGASRVKESEVIQLARRNNVSIFVAYAVGYERSMFELLARQTGGASFRLKDMRKASNELPGPRIFEVLRAHYTLTLAGNLSLGEKIKVEVKGPDKLFASALPLE
ncbi:MAG TPA: VWA domain-containing protein [Bryobacteraceae bacterium]|nr:VWA domain-containing protein [Bryobacteraceae bacterium]